MSDLLEEEVKQRISEFHEKSQKTSLKFRENYFVLPSEKIKANQQIFRFSEGCRAELKEENKEVLEKFIYSFQEELTTKENAKNLFEIIELCLENKVDRNILNYLITKLIEMAKMDMQINPLKLTILYNLMEFEEKNNEALLFSANCPNIKFHYYKPKTVFKQIQHILFPKIFFSKKIHDSYTKVSKKTINEIKNKFEEKNKGFLKLLDSFFNEKKRHPFNQKYFQNKEEAQTKILTKELLMLDTSTESKRFLLTQLNDSFFDLNKKAVLIQKYIRRFLKYSQFIKNFSEILHKQLTKNAIKIQTYIRKFLAQKKSKTLFLMKKIKSQIMTYKDKVYSYIKSHFLQSRLKLAILKERLKNLKKNSITLLQKYFRTFITRKKVLNLLNLEKSCYKIVYPFKAKKVKIKIFSNEFESRLYEFSYCEIQKTYVLYIDTSSFTNEKYKVQFIIDSIITCDGRYPIVECSDGFFYNIIDFNNRGYKPSFEKEGNKAIVYEKELKNGKSHTTSEDSNESSSSEDSSINSSLIGNYSKAIETLSLEN